MIPEKNADLSRFALGRFARCLLMVGVLLSTAMSAAAAMRDASRFALTNEQKTEKERLDKVSELTDQAALEKIALGDKSYKVRAQAVKKLSDQVLLAKIAVEDEAWSVCLEAVKNLNDQAFLAKVAVENNDPDLRKEVFKKLTDQAILAKLAVEAEVADMRKEAVKKLNDQVLLAKIAVENKDPSFRKIIFEKLTDQSLLANLVLEDHSLAVRKAALDKVTDQSLLAKLVLEDQSLVVRKAALDRLTDKALLAKIAPTLKDTIFSETVAWKLAASDTSLNWYGKASIVEISQETFEYLGQNIKKIREKKFNHEAKNQEVVYYKITKEARTFLEKYEWLSFWITVSPEFKAGLDKAIVSRTISSFTRNEDGVVSSSLTLKPEIFKETGFMQVSTASKNASLYLNGVFIGSSPFPKLTLPAGDYEVLVASDQGMHQTTAPIMEGKETVLELTQNDFVKTDNDEEQITSRSPLAWWKPLDAKLVKEIHGSNRGVIVFFASREETSFALYDKRTGVRSWLQKIRNKPRSGIFVNNDSLLWQSADSRLHSIDIETGQESQVGSMNGFLSAAPVAVESLIAFPVWDASSRHGALKAFDPVNSKWSWSFELSGKPQAVLPFQGALAALSDSRSGKAITVAGLTPAGEKLWDLQLPISESLVVENGDKNLFVWGSGENTGQILDSATGQKTKSFAIESGAGVYDAKITGSLGIFITDDRQMCVFDLGVSKRLWSMEFPKWMGDRTRLLKFTKDYAVLLSEISSKKDIDRNDEYSIISVLSSKTGSFLFVSEAGPESSAEIIDETKLFHLDSDGKILVRDLERGFTSWEFSTAGKEEKDNLSSAVHGDMAYVLSPNKSKIYAFDVTVPNPLGNGDIPVERLAGVLDLPE